MRKIYIYLILCIGIFFTNNSYGQNHVAELVRNDYAAYGQPVTIKGLLNESASFKDIKSAEAVSKASYFEFNKVLAIRLMENNEPVMSLEIQLEGQQVTLDLISAESTFKDAEFETTDGRRYTRKDVDQIFYRGVIRGKESNSLVALAINENEIAGFISNDKGNFVIGKLSDSPIHIIYLEDNLKEKLNYNCGTVDDTEHIHEDHKANETGKAEAAVTLDKCVKMSYVTRYDMYQYHGNDSAVLLRVTLLHNQVSTLYLNESVRTPLSAVLIHTSADGYAISTDTGVILSAFASTSLTLSGDAYMLLSYNLSGGRAYVNTLCSSSSSKRGVSGIYTSYSNVPTYSWSIYVITHEFGHILGSQHTHACVWNGNNTAIDGCGPTYSSQYSEGSCAIGPVPSSSVKGTIMSYCHLIGGVGISFSNGFGPQPGDRIRTRVSNAACLSVCECYYNYTVSNPVTTNQSFTAAQTLTAQSAVSNNLIVSLSAEQVYLAPGFSVTATTGSSLYAYVNPCDEGEIYHRPAQATASVDYTVSDTSGGIKLWPNPANSTITLLVNEGMTAITITSLDGKVVYRQSLKTEENVIIDIHNLSSGIYIVGVTTSTGSTKTIKLIKN